MAKKKKGRKPQGQRPKGAKPGGQTGGSAPTPGAVPASSGRMSERERRDAARQRLEARRRAKRNRNVGIVLAVVMAIVGYLVVTRIIDSRRAAAYQRIAETADCGEVRKLGNLSRDHYDDDPTARPPMYETQPPAGGPHSREAPLAAGIYSEPLLQVPRQPNSIYHAMHSLEHGYVIVWHEGLTTDEQGALERELRGARKVIMVPYPQLAMQDAKIALTAWGRLQYCEKASVRVVEAFIDRFREATGPESNQP